MPDAQRHPNKVLEGVIREAERHGWARSRGKGYFKLQCSCGAHRKWVALTPSNANYGKNLLHWLKRTCWPPESS